MSIKLVDTDDIAPTVAIAGGGASGTLLAAHLLRGGRVRVVLVERSDRLGRGVAYGTTFPGHLLNVPTASLSGLPDDPEHFLRFVGRHHDPSAEPTTFVPRLVYGDYLEYLLAESEEVAAAGASLVRRRGEVVDVAQGLAGGALLSFADGPSLQADRAVLALGNLPPAAPRLEEGRWPDDPARFAPDPWRPGALEALAPGPVLLIGTGLTMVDIALQLSAQRPGTRLLALSRGGLLPQAHRVGGAPPSGDLPVPEAGSSLLSLLRFVRASTTARELAGGDWRDTVNALRPVTQALWAGLPPSEQRRFVNRLARFWDTHRHRLAPQVATSVEQLRRSGRLTIESGRIRSVTVLSRGLGVSVRDRASGRISTLHVASVVNCSGPNGDVRTSPLLEALCASGMARPHPLALGLDCGRDGALRDASGRESDTLFAIGPLRRGQLWETTAVPEIRSQAVTLARRLVPERSLAELVPPTLVS